MKQKSVFALLLALTLLFTSLLSSCESAPSSDVDQTVESTQETIEKTEESKNEGNSSQSKYLANRLNAEQVNSLPIATEDMTYEERRQLALDYFYLQLTFQWLPNMDITDYPMTYGTKNKEILSTAIYVGVPYQSKGSGNLYRWLEYYDEETAVMDIQRAFAENGGYGEDAAMTDVEDRGNFIYKKYRSLMTFFNQCSFGAFWGWGRVINSVHLLGTAWMNAYNGFIPLGYTYPNMETLDKFGEVTDGNPTGYDTVNVIEDWNAANGDDGMYRCYAKMKPADLLVSDTHTMMVKKVTLQKKTDGTIDYERSYVAVQEQGEKWSFSSTLHKKRIFTQGETEKEYTFRNLQSQEYIPFTFAEFLDPNVPEEKVLLDSYYASANVRSHLEDSYTNFSFTKEQLMDMTGPGLEKAVLFTNLQEGLENITMAQFEEMALGSNYSISDVFVIVKDKDGNELKKNVYRATNGVIREVTMKTNNSTWQKDDAGNYLNMTDGIAPLATGENTIEITVQLSTGEKLTAFSGKLLA